MLALLAMLSSAASQAGANGAETGYNQSGHRPKWGGHMASIFAKLGSVALVGVVAGGMTFVATPLMASPKSVSHPDPQGRLGRPAAQ